MKSRIIILVFVMVITIPLMSWAPGGSLAWKDSNRESMSLMMEAMNRHFIHMQYYEVNITDMSYSDYTTVTYHEKSSGYFKRTGDKFHSYALGVHTIQDKNCRIAVDSIKKTIMIADPTDYYEKLLTASDYSVLLKACVNVREARLGNETTYRLEFGQGSPFAAYEITIKDSLPEKIIFYYSKAVKGTNEKVSAKPRMEILFDNWKMNESLVKDGYEMAKYLDKQGDKYVLKSPYVTKYKLMDERVLTRTDKK